MRDHLRIKGDISDALLAGFGATPAQLRYRAQQVAQLAALRDGDRVRAWMHEDREDKWADDDAKLRALPDAGSALEMNARDERRARLDERRRELDLERAEIYRDGAVRVMQKAMPAAAAGGVSAELPVALDAAPAPVRTGVLLNLLRRIDPAREWQYTLAKPRAAWLRAARVDRGRAGVAASWLPVDVAVELVERGAAIEVVDRAFTAAADDDPTLADWLSDWRERRNEIAARRRFGLE